MPKQINTLRETYNPAIALDSHHHFTRFQKRAGAMDPQWKLLLNEFKGLGDRFDAVEKRIDGVEHTLGYKFKSIEDALIILDTWKLQITSAVEPLQLEMGVLRKHIDQVVVDSSVASVGLLMAPEMVGQCPSIGDTAIGPNGHHEQSDHRENVFGSVTTLSHPGQRYHSIPQPAMFFWISHFRFIGPPIIQFMLHRTLIT
ncbi:uncharacterized protein LOC133904336 [Phragmites australis]|uniref:uncharacterized protein LOC133904336 n=1 Tax=Phragmites australis TaxID=29695 RepID=UPI002D765AE8|nr:uncharacterized protein LOC133904336 [Phragmites australis]